MEGKNSMEMGRSSSENLLIEDEVFHDLSPLDFKYPNSNSINFDLDDTYLLDNPSGTPLHSSTDVLRDQTVVHDGGISDVQAGEFGLSDQERAILNLSPIPDQGITDQGINGMSFNNLLMQGMNSGEVPSIERTGTSCTNFLTPGKNHLTVLGQEMSELGSPSYTSQNIISPNFQNQEMSMVDLLNLPTQVTYMNNLELHNQGSSSRDTFGIPTQESFTNTLGFQTYNPPMMTALGLPAPQLTSVGFENQESNINTSGVPDQSPPVYATMGDNRGTGEIIVIRSSDDEELQEESDSTDGDDDGASGSNRNSVLRQSISKEMISQYFHLSIKNAARALNIGTTLLKRRCRELAIKRWPQRKVKSLQAIISSLQNPGEASGSIVGGNVQDRIRRLENERKRIEDNPDLPLEDDTVRLRQSIYKSSHRKRKQSDRDN